MASRISPNDGQRSRRKTSLPVLVLADRIIRQIKIDASGERKGHDQRRRHEEVRLDVLMHARFEISIAGKNRGRDQIVFVDRLLDLRMERAGVADAGRATVADEIESELIEIRLQSGLGEVIGDDARSRRERSLHRRIDRQSALDRFLREQTGGEHHARVTRVRATGDRRDQDAAVADLAFAVMKWIGRFLLRIRPRYRASDDSKSSRACSALRPARFPGSRLSVEGIVAVARRRCRSDCTRCFALKIAVAFSVAAIRRPAFAAASEMRRQVPAD